MARYFFDVHDGLVVTDDFGQELPDLDVAKQEAVRIASKFAAAPHMIGEHGGAVVVVVRAGPENVALKVRLVFDIETA